MTEADTPDPITTNVGWAAIGDNLFRGYSVSNELFRADGYWSLLSLAAGHRRLDAPEAEFLDRLAAASNVSDPRIWPLKFTWILGSYGEPLTALGALLIWLGGSRIGPSPAREAAAVWIELGELREREAIGDWFERHRREGTMIPGFGVPGREEDERVVLGKALVREYGRNQGPAYRCFERVEAVLRTRGRLRPNVVSLVSVCALDLGFSPRQLAFVMWPALQLSAIANAMEASEQRPAVLRRLPDHAVRYEGPAPRTSARARGPGKP